MKPRIRVRRSQMKCPHCDKFLVSVSNTCPQRDNSIVRYRFCTRCGYEFKTVERIDLTYIPQSDTATSVENPLPAE